MGQRSSPTYNLFGSRRHADIVHTYYFEHGRFYQRYNGFFFHTYFYEPDKTVSKWCRTAIKTHEHTRASCNISDSLTRTSDVVHTLRRYYFVTVIVIVVTIIIIFIVVQRAAILPSCRGGSAQDTLGNRCSPKINHVTDPLRYYCDVAFLLPFGYVRVHKYGTYINSVIAVGVRALRRQYIS